MSIRFPTPVGQGHPHASKKRTGATCNIHRSHFVFLGMHLAVSHSFRCQKALHTKGMRLCAFSALRWTPNTLSKGLASKAIGRAFPSTPSPSVPTRSEGRRPCLFVFLPRAWRFIAYSLLDSASDGSGARTSLSKVPRAGNVGRTWTRTPISRPFLIQIEADRRAHESRWPRPRSVANICLSGLMGKIGLQPRERLDPLKLRTATQCEDEPEGMGADA